MKTYTKFSYIKKLTLLSLIVLSSEVQADMATIIHAAIKVDTDAIKTVVDNLDLNDIGIPENTGGTASIAGILGDVGSVTGSTSISAALGDLTNNSATSTVAAILGDPTVSTGAASVSAAVGSLANTGGTATVAGLLGDIGLTTGAASISVTLAYMIANVQVDPITQVNSAKDLTALTTAITLGGTPVGGTTTLKNTYETNLGTARTAAATATTIATQTNASTATAITNVGTAITDFDALMTQIIGVADDSYISSTYTEARIKWALYQLLWSLKQLESNQATA